MTQSRPEVKAWKGLTNTVDPLRRDLSWLTQADNVNITQTGSVVRMQGYAQRTSNYAIAGAYATKDLQRLYVIDAGELREMQDGYGYKVLRTGLSSNRYYFTEVNGVVYYANGTDYGMIDGQAWRWGIEAPVAPILTPQSGSLKAGTYHVCCTYSDERGIESGSGEVESITVGDGSAIAIQAPTQDGLETNVYITYRDGTVYYRLGTGQNHLYNGQPLYEELRFWLLNPPRGTIPEVFQGTMYLAESYPEHDQTVIWRSLPLHFHHFDPGSEGIVVPGQVRMLKATQEVLLIGTDRAVYAFNGEALVQLANYGVAPGYHAAEHDGQVYFWTLRGLCVAMPFRNLTQDTVSVAPGESAGAMVVAGDGYLRYVVAMQKGGVPYNVRKQ